MRLIKDSRGKKSWHVTLGVIWTTVFGLKAMFSGHHLIVYGVELTTASFPGAEYILYVSPWLAAMGFRDWNNRKGTTNGSPTESSSS